MLYKQANLDATTGATYTYNNVVGIVALNAFKAANSSRNFNVAPENELIKADGSSTVQVTYGIDFSNFDGKWYTVTQLNTIATWAQSIYAAYQSFADVATGLEG